MPILKFESLTLLIAEKKVSYIGMVFNFIIVTKDDTIIFEELFREIFWQRLKYKIL